MPINKQATKKTGRQRKEQIVAELIDKFDGSEALVFADYQGLTNKQLENLKKELKKLDATLIVAKNTLLKLALEKSPPKADQPLAEKLDEILKNPTATVFIRGDMMEPLKKLQKAIKDFGLPKIKFGILEGTVLDEAGVLKIASLPTRDILLSQLVGELNSPIRGLATALNGTIQKFVMTLDAVAQNKPSQPALQGETLQAQTVPAELAVQIEQPQPTEPPQPVQEQPDQTTTQADQPTPETEQPTEESKSEAQNPNSETNPNDQNTNE